MSLTCELPKPLARHGCRMFSSPDFARAASVSIDVYSQRTTWSCVYVRLVDANHAVWLPRGSRVECLCRVDLATDTPRYAISMSVACPGEALQHLSSYSWCGDN